MGLSRQEIQAIIDSVCGKDPLSPERIKREIHEWENQITRPTPCITWKTTTVIEDYKGSR